VRVNAVVETIFGPLVREKNTLGQYILTKELRISKKRNEKCRIEFESNELEHMDFSPKQRYRAQQERTHCINITCTRYQKSLSCCFYFDVVSLFSYLFHLHTMAVSVPMATKLISAIS